MIRVEWQRVGHGSFSWPPPRWASAKWSNCATQTPGCPTLGGLDAPADAFSRRALGPLVTRMVQIIRLHRPDVVVTYPPNGLSGHPDHVRTHDVVTAALCSTVRDLPRGDGATGPRLYYIAFSRTRLKVVQDAVIDVMGDDTWAPSDEMAVDDEQITTVIDVSNFWADKLRALAAHGSQSDAAAVLHMLASPAGLDADEARVEEFVRVQPTGDDPHGELEHDFFP